MDFSIKSGSPEKQRTACVIVGIFSTRRLSNPAKTIDIASKQHLSALIRRGDMDGDNNIDLDDVEISCNLEDYCKWNSTSNVCEDYNFCGNCYTLGSVYSTTIGTTAGFVTSCTASCSLPDCKQGTLRACSRLLHAFHITNPQVS